VVLIVLTLLIVQGAQAPVTIARGSASGIEVAREVVVRTPAEWDALWGEHGDQRPRPAVDLSSQMVAAVFIGTRPTAGYTVEITGARVEPDGLVIDYEERQPPPGVIVPQMLSAPYHMVTLPHRDGAVRFVKKGQP